MKEVVAMERDDWRSQTAVVIGDRRFWVVQAAVWSAYAAALLIPWIGTYTIASMLPNKAVVAMVAVALSTGIGISHRLLAARFTRPQMVMPALALLCVTGGFLWHTVTTQLLGSAASLDIGRLGILASGVPQLSGPLYHALVLLAWSLGFLAVHRPQRAIDHASGRWIVRDGRHVVILKPDDVDWIEARGDYIRVHVGARRLMLRDTMTRLESALPPGFIRIHRSAIVNASRVRELIRLPNRECYVVLVDGSRLRASRTYADDLRQAVGTRGALYPPP